MKAAESKDSYIPILHTVSTQIGCIPQRRLPSHHLILRDLLVFIKCFSKTSRLISHIRWFHMVENWHYRLPLLYLALHDLIQLIQAPFWMSIGFRKNHNIHPRFFNSLQEWWPDLFSSIKSFFVSEGADVLLTQSGMNMISKSEASVTSKAQKDVPTPSKWKTLELVVGAIVGDVVRPKLQDTKKFLGC